MPRLQPQRAERILIRSANWVGDAVMTTPAVHAIRANFPASHITLLAKPWVAPVFEHNPDIDEIMLYQARGRHSGPVGLWRLAGDMRRRRFELAILFQNAFEAALLAFLARIPRRLGFTTDGRTLLLTERIRTWRPLKHGHLVDYYLGLLAGAGMTLHGRRLTLVLTAAERQAARQALSREGLGDAAPLVGLNPGATFGTAKRWLPERYTELGHRMASEHGAAVVIFGAPNEAELGRELAARIGGDCVNFAGRTTLRQAMAMVGCCDLFITNDSGLMHVAAALDIPQVAVIGPTDPVATGPINAASRVVHLPETCEFSPCLKSFCPIQDHRCMTAISVDRVLQTGLALLAQARGR